MLKIININDPMLYMISKPVEVIDSGIIKIIKDMFESMYANNGIGLAAVQVGILKRIFIVDIPDILEPAVFINPQITYRSPETFEYEEGCLSLPGVQRKIKRSKKVTADFTDLDGNKQTINASGLLSVCIQHEYDHLEGKMFIDNLDSVSRESAFKEFTEKYSK